MTVLLSSKEVEMVLTTRWTTLGPPMSPTVSFLRGVGQVRITQEDIDRYGESFLENDPELLLERTMDDPEARYRIKGPVPQQAPIAEDPVETGEKRGSPKGPRPQRGGSSGFWARLFGR